MSVPWPTVSLGRVLTHRKEFIKIDDTLEYVRPRVQLHAQGIVLRDRVTGAAIKTKVQQVCRAGEFLVAEIDAKVGGFGIVPGDLDGAIVSSHYFLYTVDPGKLDNRLLGYYARTPAFRDQVAAQGTTNYAAIRPQQVLGYTIPLPPLAEQRQIVAVIEGLAAKIEEARGLQIQVAEGWENLCRGLLLSSEGKLTPMREIVDQREPDVTVARHEAYDFAGVYCFGGGVFKGQRKSGMKIGYSRLTRLRAGDFVYPKLMAWEGALSVVPVACDGLVVSPEFPVFEIRQNLVLPEVLDVYFRTPSVWPLLGAISTGTNVRRRRLHPDRFLAFEMPLPPRERQYQLRGLKTKVDLMKALQAQAAAELDALLPAVLDRAFQGEL